MKPSPDLQFLSKATLVYESLKQQINSGRLAAGEMFPTTIELAKQFGVSIATINQAMQQLVNEKFVVRIRRKGSFVADLGKTLRREIGFYLPMLKGEAARFPAHETLWTDIFTGALVMAERAGYRLTAIPDMGGNIVENIGRFQVDGVILHGGGTYFSAFEPFIMSGLARKMNYLFINRQVDFSSVNYVDEISREDLAAMFRTILASGHRRVGLIGRDFFLRHFAYSQHIDAYQEVMDAAGVYNPAYIKRVNPIHPELNRPGTVDPITEQAIRELLALPEPPTLLVIYREGFLEQTTRVLDKLGVRVPEDLQLVLVGNRGGEPYEYRQTPLNAFLLPTKQQFGEFAVRKMIEIIEKRCPLPLNCSLPLSFEPGASWPGAEEAIQNSQFQLMK